MYATDQRPRDGRRSHHSEITVMELAHDSGHDALSFGSTGRLLCLQLADLLLLYVGWVLLDWRKGILLFFGVLLLAVIISGVVLNTIFLVREIRRNEQHDAFINAVTHELKTPVASIRLYLETLMTRTVDEGKRQEFYRIMHEGSNRLVSTIENIMGDFTGVEWHPDEVVLRGLPRISPSGNFVKFVLSFHRAIAYENFSRREDRRRTSR